MQQTLVRRKLFQSIRIASGVEMLKYTSRHKNHGSKALNLLWRSFWVFVEPNRDPFGARAEFE
jgi:hypothetical protein